MSGHHGHHRHSRHRRHRHRSNRNSGHNNSTSNNSSHHNGGTLLSRGTQLKDANGLSDWTEFRSSSGKLYYYNKKTGVSQWELPAELRPQRATSPGSEISESSSIRQNLSKSPNSSPSRNSVPQDLIHEDKPLLTPSLEQYFKPEAIVPYVSAHLEKLEKQANGYAKEAFELSQNIFEESVDLKYSKSVVNFLDTQLMAQEVKYGITKATIEYFKSNNP